VKVDDAGETSTNEFAHVTNLNANDDDPGEACEIVLAYACVRLAHLSHDFLGDSKAAARLYREASMIDPLPSSVAFDGIGTAIEASGGDLSEAIQAYKKAHEAAPRNSKVAFHLAVALERNGEVEKSNEIMEKLRRGEAADSSLVDSWGYVRWHTRRVKPLELNLHRGTRAMLKVALDAASDLITQENGLVCEFGVASGRSIRMTQELLPLNVKIHGFDTFTGLPAAWGSEPVGA